MTSPWSRLGVAITTILATLSFLPGAAPAAPTTGWSAVWATAPQRPGAKATDNWSTQGFANQTVRQIVRVSAGGPSLRIRLSNRYGQEPFAVAHATVARTALGAAVQPGSLRRLTVGLTSSFEIAPGSEVPTDPVLLPVEPWESVTVTIFFARPTGPATYHAQAATTSYRANGDHASDTTAAAFADTSQSWYYLAGVDVMRLTQPDIIVAFGDSITDGYRSSVDGNRRYPDELAQQLAAAGRARPVLNAGISGNRVIVNSPQLGDSAVSRFGRDVLAQPGVGTALVLAGINDIGLSGEMGPDGRPSAMVTAARLIDGHRDLIRQARAAGIRIVGATLLPFAGSVYHTAAKEVVRAAVNTWIRTSGAYDAIVDLDAATASPTDRTRMNTTLDSGDHLHPNDIGYRTIAAAITASGL